MPQRRNEGFLDCVLGEVRIPQMLLCVALQIAAVLLEQLGDVQRAFGR